MSMISRPWSFEANSRCSSSTRADNAGAPQLLSPPHDIGQLQP